MFSPQSPHLVSLILTNFGYTVIPSIVDEVKLNKNEAEIEGMRLAYLCDGVSFTQWFAWLEDKFSQGFDVTEHDALRRLRAFRMYNKPYLGLSHKNTSASGPNAGKRRFVRLFS